MEITSPVVKTEEVIFEIVLLLVAFPPIIFILAPGSAGSFISLTLLKQKGPEVSLC